MLHVRYYFDFSYLGKFAFFQVNFRDKPTSEFSMLAQLSLWNKILNLSNWIHQSNELKMYHLLVNQSFPIWSFDPWSELSFSSTGCILQLWTSTVTKREASRPRWKVLFRILQLKLYLEVEIDVNSGWNLHFTGARFWTWSKNIIHEKFTCMHVNGKIQSALNAIRDLLTNQNSKVFCPWPQKYFFSRLFKLKRLTI